MNCDYCPKILTSNYAWAVHVNQELAKFGPKSSFICQNCNYQCGSITHLRTHLKARSCRESNIPRHQCIHCKKFFTSKSTLQRHLQTNACGYLTRLERTTTPVPFKCPGPFKCTQCHRYFVSEVALMSHMLVHGAISYTPQPTLDHRVPFPWTSSCKYCNRPFTSRKAVSAHLARGICLPKNPTDRWLIQFIWDAPDIDLSP